MGRDKSWHWEHFERDGSKSNGTHYKAFCKYCVQHEYDQLNLVEQAALNASSISQACSKDILRVEGAFHFCSYDDNLKN